MAFSVEMEVLTRGTKDSWAREGVVVAVLEAVMLMARPSGQSQGWSWQIGIGTVESCPMSVWWV